MSAIEEMRLGWTVRQVLTRAGLPQERYIEVKAWFLNQDVKVTHCRCKKREKQLDELGQLAIKAFRYLGAAHGLATIQHQRPADIGH